MFTWIIFLLFFAITVLFYRLKIQEERLRVFTAFVAGLFERSVKHSQAINENYRYSELELFKDSQEYKETIRSIACYFEENYWAQPVRKFLLSKWNLYVDNGLANGGFDEIYKDFFLYLIKGGLEEENSLFSVEEKKRFGLLVKKMDGIDTERRNKLSKSPSIS